ncbi:MAG TPA: SDR family oxidoreductase [Sphingomonas sp.]|nr:SDR family oxidoreductase [Sphingomonas sp.]
MDLQGQTAVVTGGSRGLGLGIVEALVDRGANVTVVARSRHDLDAISRRLGVATISADITDRDVAMETLARLRPGVLILNAGAPPEMGRIDQLSWEAFSSSWEIDVKGGFHWIQAALAAPLAPGSRVLVTSSGAAVGGSPLTGGYAGAKRMLWIMANYAEHLSTEKGLGIRFQTIIPRQQIGGTGIGDRASTAYGKKLGIPAEEFLKRFGAPLPPRQLGEYVAHILEDPQYEQGRAFNLKGDTGLTVMEEAAA